MIGLVIWNNVFWAYKWSFLTYIRWFIFIQMRLTVNVHTLNNGIKHGNLVLIHKTIAIHPFPCHLHYSMHCKLSKHHLHVSSFLSSPIVFESIYEHFFLLGVDSFIKKVKIKTHASLIYKNTNIYELFYQTNPKQFINITVHLQP